MIKNKCIYCGHDFINEINGSRYDLSCSNFLCKTLLAYDNDELFYWSAICSLNKELFYIVSRKHPTNTKIFKYKNSIKYELVDFNLFINPPSSIDELNKIVSNLITLSIY